MPYSGIGKVGRIASEEAVLRLLNSKCIAVLLYGLEACPLLKSDLSSLCFVIVRFLMKLFNSNNVNIINIIVDNILTLSCLVFSGVIVLVYRFEKKYTKCDKIVFCKISVSIR